MKEIFSWSVVLPSVITLALGGFGVLTLPRRPEYRIAQALFIIAAVYFWLAMGFWGVKTTHTIWVRGIILVVSMGVSAWLAIEGVRLVEGRKNEEQQEVAGNRPHEGAPLKETPGGPSRPSPSPSLTPPKFGAFLNDLKPLHNGYKTYRVIAEADDKACDYYARLGILTRDEVRLAVYITCWYTRKEVMLSVIDNYEKIIEDLKLQMKNEGTEIFGLEVSKTVVVYLDIDPGIPNYVPSNEAQKKGITFYVER